MNMDQELTPGAAAVPDPEAIENPRGEIRLGLFVAALFFIGLVGWAAFAPLDAAAYAQGQLVVSGQRQSVQHRDGGVVAEILVREGVQVQRGQVLMRLSAPEVKAQERTLSVQVIGLLAQRARLRAEQLGLSDVPVPPEFAGLTGEDVAEAQTAMRVQRTQLRARASLLNAQRGVLGQRTAQSSEQGQGYQRQREAAATQLRLITEELNSLKEVARRGFVSQTRIRALERAQADLEGQLGQFAAEASRAREAGGESQLQIVEGRMKQQEEVTSELREAEAALAELQPKLAAARDQLARTEIRAPATGTVVGLSIFTPGGVVAPGQRLLDIVPTQTPLVIEARIAPQDADDLSPGQETLVRFASLNDRSLPELRGELSRLSADHLIDERTGESYFTAEVTVPRDQLSLITDRRGADFQLRPGMPVEVLIPLRRRTALEYALEPFTQAAWTSFREQ
jgi:HlyD family secretion protein